MQGTLEDALNNARLPVLPCSSLLWDLGGTPREWSDACGRVKPPRSQPEWLMRKHDVFDIDRDGIGLSSEDQTNHCEMWIHLSHVGTPMVERDREQRERRLDNSAQGERKQKLHLAERTIHPLLCASKVIFKRRLLYQRVSMFFLLGSRISCVVHLA